MKIRTKLGGFTLGVLLVFAMCFIVAGTVAIHKTVYFLNRERLQLDLVNVVEGIYEQVIHFDPTEKNSPKMAVSQREVLKKLAKHRVSLGGSLIVYEYDGGPRMLLNTEKTDSRIPFARIRQIAGEFEYSGEGGDRLVIYERIPQWDWIIVLDVPTTEIYRERTVFLKSVLWQAGLLLVLITGLVVIYSRRISDRIDSILAVLKKVQEGNFEERVDCNDESDELGQLARGVNKTVDSLENLHSTERAQINSLEMVQRQLSELSLGLEQRVTERTKALSENVEKLEEEIARRAVAEEKNKQMDLQMVEANRIAGSGELASSVLLNLEGLVASLFVSSGQLKRNLETPLANNLHELVEVLQGHRHELLDYLSKDDRAENTLHFLETFLIELNDLINGGVRAQSRLRDKIELISEIMDGRKNYQEEDSKVQACDLVGSFEVAIQHNRELVQAFSSIQIEREFEGFGEVQIDRHALLQVLTCLITNSLASLKRSKCHQPKLSLRLARISDEEIAFEVESNANSFGEDPLFGVFQFGVGPEASFQGLGLNRAAYLASRLHAQIWTKNSADGEGVNFVMHLPVAVAAEAHLLN